MNNLISISFRLPPLHQQQSRQSSRVKRITRVLGRQDCQTDPKTVKNGYEGTVDGRMNVIQNHELFAKGRQLYFLYITITTVTRSTSKITKADLLAISLMIFISPPQCRSGSKRPPRTSPKYPPSIYLTKALLFTIFQVFSQQYLIFCQQLPPFMQPLFHEFVFSYCCAHIPVCLRKALHFFSEKVEDLELSLTVGVQNFFDLVCLIQHLVINRLDIKRKRECLQQKISALTGRNQFNCLNDLSSNFTKSTQIVIQNSNMFGNIIALFVLLVALHAQAQPNATFPKILWVYWQQGFDNAPPFTQLSIQNKERFAAESGWELRFLTEKTIQEYIDVGEIEAMMELAEDKLVQLKADILRMMLIYRYGGMWMDANSFFLHQLDWLEHIEQDPRVYNKLSPQPDILIAAYTKYSHSGNITYRFDDHFNQTINVFPGLENWFMVAKPKSQFLGDALQKLKVILRTTKKVMDKQILSQGILLSEEHLDPYLIGSDYLFQILLQSKQKELERQGQGKGEEGGARYAVEHYKIWHFEADESVYKLTVYSRFKRYQMWADLITYSLDDLTDALPESPPFLKFVGWQHPDFSLYLQNYAQFNCWGGSSLIQNQSVIHRFLLDGYHSPFITAIDAIEGGKNDEALCKSSVDRQYLQTNHEKKINLAVQLLFALLIIVMMTCVKSIHNFCEISLKFQEIPNSYR